METKNTVRSVGVLAVGLLALSLISLADEPLKENSREKTNAASPRVSERMLSTLKRENPEVYERLVQLRETDREEFFKQLRQTINAGPGKRRNPVGSRAPRGGPEERRCQELSRAYHEAEDPEQKKKLKAELAVAVEQAFNVRITASRERLARFEAELKKLRERLEGLEANREAVCRDRIEKLTQPPELKWEGTW